MMLYTFAYTKMYLCFQFSSFVHSFNYTIFNPTKAYSSTAEETDKLCLLMELSQVHKCTSNRDYYFYPHESYNILSFVKKQNLFLCASSTLKKVFCNRLLTIRENFSISTYCHLVENWSTCNTVLLLLFK